MKICGEQKNFLTGVKPNSVFEELSTGEKNLFHMGCGFVVSSRLSAQEWRCRFEDWNRN